MMEVGAGVAVFVGVDEGTTVAVNVGVAMANKAPGLQADRTKTRQIIHGQVTFHKILPDIDGERYLDDKLELLNNNLLITV